MCTPIFPFLHSQYFLCIIFSQSGTHFLFQHFFLFPFFSFSFCNLNFLFALLHYSFSCVHSVFSLLHFLSPLLLFFFLFILFLPFFFISLRTAFIIDVYSFLSISFRMWLSFKTLNNIGPRGGFISVIF